MQKQQPGTPDDGGRVARSAVQMSDEPGDTTATTVSPVVAGKAVKEWSFAELRGDALDLVEIASGIQVGGLLNEIHDYGPTFRDSDVFLPDETSRPPDGIATGQITSFEDDVTYWVGAEAPAGIAALPDAPIGSVSTLRLTQSFIKRSDDASLSFTLSAAFIETTDLNAGLARECPAGHSYGLVCDLIKGELFVNVAAFTVPPPPDVIPFDVFFQVAGRARVIGYAENWSSSACSTSYSQLPFWTVEDFDFVIDELDGAPEGLVLMILRGSRTFDVDLSSVAVGQAFTLRTTTTATAYNRIAGPPSEFGSSATAFLRDPNGIGGTAITFSGLEETDAVSLDDPPESPVEPVPCSPDSTAEAGSLQFSADSYTVGESDQIMPVRVVRTGGSSGAVTATIATSDGTGVAGTDYVALNSSVFFGDGDDEPRAVEITVLPDQVGGQDDRTLTMTLSNPGGCATLGSPATAELRIRDDDPAPVPVQPFALDPTFGTGGKATTTGVGGDRSSMALTPDGAIVLAGGTFSAFVMARFTADGVLDTGFGDQGTVSTVIGGTPSQQESLGVAIQADGKIMLAGYRGSDVAVARFLPDGQPDESFGTAGAVTTIASGQALGVAVQPDRRIVVAGIAAVDRDDDFGDLFVARLLEDGSPDGSFNLSGQVFTDVLGQTNQAQNVRIQPDDMILVSGSSPNPTSNGVGIDHHTDLARYQPGGVLDPDFGDGGTVRLDAFVGAGLAIQPDRRLVLVGTVDTTPPTSPPGTFTDIAVMRLNPDGAPDESFGERGVVHFSASALTSPFGPGRDAGHDVALQADGRIVVVGNTGPLNADFAVARLLPDGTLDTGFTDTGVMSIDFSRFTDIAENVAINPDGKIVVSGQARGARDGYGVVRLAPVAPSP
jgi:uncharacterized delta-60 repeat protein